jgi:hypothetical protein
MTQVSCRRAGKNRERPWLHDDSNEGKLHFVSNPSPRMGNPYLIASSSGPGRRYQEAQGISLGS